MSRDTSLRWAAAVGALATLVMGGLFAFREGTPLAAFVVAPLLIGLVGATLARTWGVFGTLGGAALILVAVGVGEMPGWAAFTAVAGLAVITPALLRAFRFDAAAAAAWLTLAGLTGSGAALAWDELDEQTAPPSATLEKPVTPEGWNVRLRFDTRWDPAGVRPRSDRDADRPCDRRQRHRQHLHRRPHRGQRGYW